MNEELKKILKEISKHTSTGRMFEANEDPFADDEKDQSPESDDMDALFGDESGGDAGGADDLFGGDDSMGGDFADSGSPEDDVVDAEGDKAKAEADAAKAKADAAKAEADKEKSEAEREKAEAEADSFNGIELFSRPGVSFLVGILLDDYNGENKVDELAQLFVSKLRLDDQGMQKFKAQSGPLLKLPGFQQLLSRMESILSTSTNDDVETATEMA